MANWQIVFLKSALVEPTWKRFLLTSLNLSCASDHPEDKEEITWYLYPVLMEDKDGEKNFSESVQ